MYLGVQFALTAMGGLGLGFWLDRRHYLPQPLGTIGGLMGGAVLGMYVLARSLK